VGCAVLATLSAAQIYFRQLVHGVPASLSDQLALNLVAWLPWIPLALLVDRLSSRAIPAKTSMAKAVILQLAAAHGIVGSYLVYLAAFRFAFFPGLTGDLSWLGLGRQVALAAGEFYLPATGLYALIFGLAHWLERKREAVGDKNWNAPDLPNLGEAAAPQESAGRTRPRPGSGKLQLAIRSLGRTEFVAVHEINWIEGEGSYVRLHLRDHDRLLRRTLSSLAEELAEVGFTRIHRSRIVNHLRVREVRPLTHGDAEVALDDGTTLRLSRSYRAALHRALEPNNLS
jgi:two-component system LytT family response regulator